MNAVVHLGSHTKCGSQLYNSLMLDSKNKKTHSYTVQPLVSRDGRTLGKLLICLQEPKGDFGPRVEQQVRSLERELGNVRVVLSTSRKM